MALLKSITRNGAVRRVLCALGAAYIRLVYVTGRWEVKGGDIPRRLWDAGTPFLLSFWHGRMLMAPKAWDRRVAIDMLISNHPDGRFIAQTMGHFAIGTIAGSSSAGGTGALRAILAAFKAGHCAGITPDGPRGPRMRASGGVVNVARMAGVAIVPLAFSARRSVVLNSWDRFVIALPFTRGVFVWGEAVEIPRNADAGEVEVARTLVEDRLNAVTLEADRLMGATPVTPAPSQRLDDGNGTGTGDGAIKNHGARPLTAASGRQ